MAGLPGSAARAARRQAELDEQAAVEARLRQMRIEQLVAERLAAGTVPARKASPTASVRRMAWRGRRVLLPFPVLIGLLIFAGAVGRPDGPGGFATFLTAALCAAGWWALRGRRRLRRRDHVRYAAGCLAAAVLWLTWTAATRLEVTALWGVLTWAAGSTPWWWRHWPSDRLPTAENLPAPTKPSIPDLWADNVAAEGGAAPKSVLYAPSLTKNGRAFLVQLDPGKQNLTDLRGKLSNLASGLRTPMERLVVDDETGDEDPSIVRLQIIDKSPIKKTLWFAAPRWVKGLLHLGLHADGDGAAQYRLYTDDGSMWSGFLLGGTGSGKTSLINAIAITVRAMSADGMPTVIIYLDGKNGASSPALADHATWFRGRDGAETVLRGLERALVRRYAWNKIHRLTTFHPGRRPAGAEQGLPGVLVIVDECFPAGTLVGETPIDQVRVGDVVPSWDDETRLPCEGVVRQVFRKKPSGLVRVHWSDGSSLVCTPGHPLMTNNGWAPAGVLTSGAQVLSFKHGKFTPTDGQPGARDVHGVRGGLRDHDLLPGAQVEEDGPGVLQGRVPGRDVESGESGQHPLRSGTRAQVVDSDGRAQPDAVRGRQGEDDRCSTRRTPTIRQAGQRAWAHRAAAALGRTARLAHRARREDGRPEGQGRHAGALPVGHRTPSGEGGSRDRRTVSLLAGAPRVGSAEGRVPTWRRVDRVEVLEPGSDGRYGGLCPDGHVYNLEVADTHVYQIADGVVAHNCHRIFTSENAQRWSNVAREGRGVGIGILAASQHVGLATFGGSEELRSSLFTGNLIALRTKSNTAVNMLGELGGVDPTTFPKLPGFGYKIAEDGDDERSVPFRGEFLPSAVDAEEYEAAAGEEVPVPIVDEWFEQTDDAEIDEMTEAAFGPVFVARVEIEEKLREKSIALIEGREDPTLTIVDPTQPPPAGTPRLVPVADLDEDEPEDEDQADTTRQLILQLLAEGSRTKRELEKLTGKSDSSVKQALRKLVEDGVIERLSRGVYALANTEAAV